MNERLEVPSTEGMPALARIIFTVGGPLVGLNAAYRPGLRTGKVGAEHATIRMTDAGKEYKARVRQHAEMRLSQVAGWPRDPFRALHVRLSMFAFNTKHDAGAASKVVSDALEGVLYDDDRVVSFGEMPRAGVDDRGPRLVVCAELLEGDTEAGAEARCAAVLNRARKRA